jgi:hypothetical protein
MKKLTIVLFVLLTISESYAYDNKLVHQAINTQAVQHSQQFVTTMKSLGFVGNLPKEIIELNFINNRQIKEWFLEGGKAEDEPVTRTFNHFHDPTKVWEQAGFSGLFSGCSSLLWAQNSCSSANDKWSWQKAREYFYTALTTDISATRDQNFADTFRALGQQIHLLSDASVPEHTRNDPHVFPGTYETWCKRNVDKLNTTATAVDYAITNNSLVSGLAPISNFWDTFPPAGTTTTPRGLAEYTNFNFVSGDTIFKDFEYPQPPISFIIDNITAKDGKIDKRVYFIGTTSDGITINHLASTGYLWAELSEVSAINMDDSRYVLDDECFKDYASILIPKAVGYSAALIDYFFRGTIQLTIPDSPSERYSHIRLKARNITAGGEEMANPEEIKLVIKYKLMKEDPSQGKLVKDGDEYHYIVAPLKNMISSIPRDNPVDLEFDLSANPLPMWAYDVTLQVVYKGKLGNETGAVAVGLVKLPAIGGDIELALPDKGIYGITTPDGSFTKFSVKATNNSTTLGNMSDGSIELMIWYKLASQDPFQNHPTVKSPLVPERYYMRVPEKNLVRTIPTGTSTELVFDLSQKPLPLWATDLDIFVVYTGQVGSKPNEIVVGARNIAEPTPIDLVNNMDYICLNGSYMPAGSQAAIDIVGTTGDRPLQDIYPHRLKDIYLAFTSTLASENNYSAKIPIIQPGEYGRVFLLTDYSFNMSSKVTVENIADAAHDIWVDAFDTSIETFEGVSNGVAYVNGEYFDIYPGMFMERGVLSWSYFDYQNMELPTGSTCDQSGAQILSGPVAVEFPQ